MVVFGGIDYNNIHHNDVAILSTEDGNHSQIIKKGHYKWLDIEVGGNLPTGRQGSVAALTPRYLLI